MAAKRVYLVVEQSGGRAAKLVRASSPAQAIRHVVGNTFSAEVASQEKLIAAMTGGAKVEDAGEESGE